MKIIDIPCGSGEISYAMARYTNNSVEAYDISDIQIKKAEYSFQRKNLSFECKNIFEVLNYECKYDIICIINSLFLLPNTELLLEIVYNNLKQNGSLYLIIPNIKSNNFIEFQNLFPNVNLFTKTKEELINFISNKGFILESQKELIHLNYYKRKETKFFSILKHPYLLFLNSLTTKNTEPSYFLLSFLK